MKHVRYAFLIQFYDSFYSFCCIWNAEAKRIERVEKKRSAAECCYNMIKIQINQFNLLLMAGIRMYPVASLLAFQWQIKSFSMYLIPPLRGSIRKPHSSGLRRMTFANVSMALSRVHENRAAFSVLAVFDFSNPLQCRVYIFTSSFLYQLQRFSSIVPSPRSLLKLFKVSPMWQIKSTKVSDTPYCTLDESLSYTHNCTVCVLCISYLTVLSLHLHRTIKKPRARMFCNCWCFVCGRW